VEKIVNLEVILLRHGIAENRGKDGTDYNRKLTDEGKMKLKKRFPHLKDIIKYKDQVEIWSSPILRAKETAEILAEALETDKIIYHEFIGEGAFDDFLMTMVKQDQEKTIIVVGHEPTLGDWAYELSEKSIMFNKQNVVLNFAYRMADLVAAKFEDQIRKARLSWNYFYDITFDDIIGCDPSIMEVKEQARKCSDTSSNVMLYGESGTGKELFARAIHNCSIRKDNPFVAINCAAIPEGLLESELFGYEEGAFTGAKSSGKIGKFELASGGTIFLDEIGDMPIHLQAKLLRVLQERYIERVGGNGVVPVDIRIISATHKNLEELVDSGQFRGDLYYRLNVIPLYIPPIRDRQKDIKPLMDYLLKKYNKILLKDKSGFSEEVVELFKKYIWKGNIREMENVIEYAINMETSNMITMNSIPPKIKSFSCFNKLSEPGFKTLDQIEKEEIEKLLKYYDNDALAVKKCSDSLGVSIATLYRKIKKYNIEYN